MTLAMLLVLAVCPPIWAQGPVGDIFSGKLINPEVGVYAWYEVHDSATGRRFFLRQAVVGKERVKSKTGYWVETEVVPQVGFPSVYKMLLTGPAADADNVHRIFLKEGDGAAREVSRETLAAEMEDGKAKKPKRRLAGRETMQTPEGPAPMLHYVIEEEDGVTELWTSDHVRPMGIVRMESPQGEVVLQRFGQGGPDGASAIELGGGDTPPARGNLDPEPRRGPSTNFTGRKEKKQ